MKQTCKQCGREFELTQDEIDFYTGQGFDVPSRCADCRRVKKASKPQDAPSEQNKSDEPGDAGSSPALNSSEAAFLKGRGGSMPENVEGEAEGESMPGWTPAKLAISVVVTLVLIAVCLGLTALFMQGCSFSGNTNTTANTNTNANANAVSNTNSASNSNAAANNTSGVSATKYTFRNNRLLTEHWEKHGQYMGFVNKEEYEQAASEVATNPNALHKTEKEDGDDVYYIEATNDFVIVSTDGYIRTYFRPDAGINYYNRQ